MYYNAANPIEAKIAREYFEWLISNKKIFELTKNQPIRSVAQNNYLHIILKYYALESGESYKEVKEDVFKKIINPDIFKVKSPDKDIWRSTSALNSKEMTIAINRFRNYSSKMLGCYLPGSDELESLNRINLIIKNNKEFL